jgi:hypothetical protein
MGCILTVKQPSISLHHAVATRCFTINNPTFRDSDSIRARPACSFGRAENISTRMLNLGWGAGELITPAFSGNDVRVSDGCRVQTSAHASVHRLKTRVLGVARVVVRTLSLPMVTL